MEEITSGVAQRKVSLARFRSGLRIPIPNPDEQCRIIKILEDHLSRLDAAGRNLGTASRRLIALENSLLEEYFAGDGLEPLDALVTDISAGKSFGTANAPAAEGAWGIIKVSAMTWGEFKAEENKAVSAGKVDPRFEIHEGDLLVSRANTPDYVGASVLVGAVRPRLLLSDKSLRLTPANDVDSEWLWRALQAPSARRQMTDLSTGTKDSMRNISQVALRRVLLPRRDKAMQLEALAAYSEGSSAAAALHAQLVRNGRMLQQLRRSLLTAAFSGRLTSDRQHLDIEELVSL
jgi:type I restriction enzyme S subunit